MVLKSKNNWVAFMCHLERSEYDYLCDKLEEYDVQRYIIAYENEPYGHFHFLVQTNEDPATFYTNYRKRVFIDKYGLRGQAKKDLAKQYGKVKEIEDLNKMASYTVKNEDFRVYNIEQDEIDDILDNSFNKSDKIKLLKDKMISHVETALTKGGFVLYAEHQTIAEIIIQFCFENNIEVRRSLIDTYYYYFRQYTKKKELRYKPYQMFNALYKGIIQ